MFAQTPYGFGSSGGGGGGLSNAFSTLSTSEWNIVPNPKVRLFLTANVSLTLVGSIPGVSCGMIYVMQDGVGGHTLTINGTLIDIRTDPNTDTLIGVVDVGAGIYAYDTNLNGGGGDTEVPVVFDDVNVLVTVVDNVYTASNAFAWQHYGRSTTQTLPADFRMFAQYNDAATIFGAMGGNLSPAMPDAPYYDFDCGVVMYGGGLIYKIDNGVQASTGVSIALGDYFAIAREGSVLRIQRSSDGVTWNNVGAPLAFSSIATLYPVLAMYDNGILYKPKGTGVV